MSKTQKQKLNAAGWKTGDAADFLGLTPEEAALVELRVVLANYLRQYRTKKKLTQLQLAKELNSSQSRVAKMEAGDPTVSIDLLLKSLLHLGASLKQLGRIISTHAA